MTNSDDNEGFLRWENLDTLNRLIRLANITGLSFADLNALLTAWEELRKANTGVPPGKLLERIQAMLESGGA